MKTCLIALLGTAVVLTASADITLIRDGQPQVVIIVPDGLYKHLQKPAEQLTGDGVSVPLAAVELADYLGKIGGTRPQIATETQKRAFRRGLASFWGLARRAPTSRRKRRKSWF
jgi:hypothetical protein